MESVTDCTFLAVEEFIKKTQFWSSALRVVKASLDVESEKKSRRESRKR